jgi:hypothetical protein
MKTIYKLILGIIALALFAVIAYYSTYFMDAVDSFVHLKLEQSNQSKALIGIAFLINFVVWIVSLGASAWLLGWSYTKIVTSK